MPADTRQSDALIDSVILNTELSALNKLYSGKVRDIYEIDDDHLLIIATDRVSAYDVILPNGIPGKGKLLTELSSFWFEFIRDVVPNHLSKLSLADVLTKESDYQQAVGRSMLVKRLRPLPIEAVARGYLIGSGFKDYQRSGEVCGIRLPDNLPLAAQLPETLFTPATKAEAGSHDENISFAQMIGTVGEDLAMRVRDITCEIYQRAASHARERGIIIADTKFEFGLDNSGTLTLMDEILTPDSSRFWEAETWQPGVSPASYDKQYIRDYLETLDWDKTAPGPELPATIIDGTKARYREAVDRLTGQNLL